MSPAPHKYCTVFACTVTAAATLSIFLLLLPILACSGGTAATVFTIVLVHAVCFTASFLAPTVGNYVVNAVYSVTVPIVYVVYTTGSFMHPLLYFSSVYFYFCCRITDLGEKFGWVRYFSAVAFAAIIVALCSVDTTGGVINVLAAACIVAWAMMHFVEIACAFLADGVDLAVQTTTVNLCMWTLAMAVFTAAARLQAEAHC